MISSKEKNTKDKNTITIHKILKIKILLQFIKYYIKYLKQLNFFMKFVKY